jgi:hypothetical protein
MIYGMLKGHKITIGFLCARIIIKQMGVFLILDLNNTFSLMQGTINQFRGLPYCMARHSEFAQYKVPVRVF